MHGQGPQNRPVDGLHTRAQLTLLRLHSHAHTPALQQPSMQDISGGQRWRSSSRGLSPRTQAIICTADMPRIVRWGMRRSHPPPVHPRTIGSGAPEVAAWRVVSVWAPIPATVVATQVHYYQSPPRQAISPTASRVIDLRWRPWSCTGKKGASNRTVHQQRVVCRQPPGTCGS